MANKRKSLNKIRNQRKRRTRSKIFGTAEKPRLSVFRSNRYIYVQLIDDENRKTLLSTSTQELKNKDKKLKKIEQAEEVGKLIGQKAQERGIKKAVFNRREYQYHGRVKAVAEAARKAGLQI